MSAEELREVEATEGDEAQEQRKKQLIAKHFPPTDGDAGTYAQWVVARLKAAEPAVHVGEENVQFEYGTPQVCYSYFQFAHLFEAPILRQLQ